MLLKILILLTLSFQSSNASIYDNPTYINCIKYCEINYAQYKSMCILGCRIKAHNLDCYYCDRLYNSNVSRYRCSRMDRKGAYSRDAYKNYARTC